MARPATKGQGAESPNIETDYERVQNLEGLMRLVCPQCAAQYEVDINAIPQDGRDVQCANCGNTWFQEREHQSGEEAAAALSPEQTPDQNQTSDEAIAAEDAKPDSPLERPQAPPVDQSVLDILRQEAELDASARQAALPEKEPEETRETAPELASPDAGEDSENLALRARAARNRLTANRDLDRNRRIHLSTGEDENAEEYQSQDLLPPEARQPDLDPEAELTAAPQREAPEERPSRELPDVDAINSTLRSADDKSRETERKARTGRKSKPGKRGNNLGFYFAVLLFLILLAAYALETQIIAAFPEAAPYLAQYSDFVDVARHGLVNGITRLVEAVQNLLAQYL